MVGLPCRGVRYMEGSIAHYFKGRNGHTQIVNILRLNGQEDRFLSGSWDKRLLEWDLQTGDIVNEFKKSRSELVIFGNAAAVLVRGCVR